MSECKCKCVGVSVGSECGSDCVSGSWEWAVEVSVGVRMGCGIVWDGGVDECVGKDLTGSGARVLVIMLLR